MAPLPFLLELWFRLDRRALRPWLVELLGQGLASQRSQIWIHARDELLERLFPRTLGVFASPLQLCRQFFRHRTESVQWQSCGPDFNANLGDCRAVTWRSLSRKPALNRRCRAWSMKALIFATLFVVYAELPVHAGKVARSHVSHQHDDVRRVGSVGSDQAEESGSSSDSRALQEIS
jgi:hypothetical protein